MINNIPKKYKYTFLFLIITFSIFVLLYFVSRATIPVDNPNTFDIIKSLFFPLIYSLIYIFIIAIGIASILLWVWSIVDLIKNHTIEKERKIIWFIIILMTGFIGSLFYLVLEKKKA
ncbi:MAG: PLDc N-terminal domain-containing protein [Leptospirales bacterium]